MDEYAEGRMAYIAGTKREDNPYRRDLSELRAHEEWDGGWEYQRDRELLSPF